MPNLDVSGAPVAAPSRVGEDPRLGVLAARLRFSRFWHLLTAAAFFVVPVASGLIAGESLTGVAVAILETLAHLRVLQERGLVVAEEKMGVTIYRAA